MNRWLMIGVLIAIFGAVLAWRLNALSRKPAASVPDLPKPDTDLLPGAEVSIAFARGAVVITGDATDPLKSFGLREIGGAVLAPEILGTDNRLILFTDLQPANKYLLTVTTRHRTIEREFQVTDEIEPVEIGKIEFPVTAKAAGTRDWEMVFAPDASRLAIAAPTGEVGLYALNNLESAVAKFENSSAQTMAFSADGAYFFSAPRFAAGAIRVYDIKNGKLNRESAPLPSSPDAKLIRRFLFPMPTSTAVTRAGSIVIVDDEVRTGHPALHAMEFDAASDAPHRWISASGKFLSVLSPDAARLLVARRTEKDTETEIVSISTAGTESGKLLLTRLTSQLVLLPGMRTHNAANIGNAFLFNTDDGQVHCIDVAPDGALTLRWKENLHSIKEKSINETYIPVVWMSGNDRHAVVLTGQEYATASNETGPLSPAALIFLDVKSGAISARFPLPQPPLSAVASKDGRWLSISRQDSSARPFIDLFDCQPVAENKAPRLIYSTPGSNAAISTDGRFIAVEQKNSDGATPGGEPAYKIKILH
jgi:hypothetical protein